MSGARSSVIRGNEWHYVEMVDDGPTPVVSVVIPAHECQDSLDRLLASLEAQDHPAEALEVIVVDDASEPPLTVPDGVRLVVQNPEAGFGAGRARNAGASQATGDLIVFVDADLLAAPEVISKLARWHRSHPAAVVTGILGFFDVDEVSGEALDRAISDGRLIDLLDGKATNDQAWRDKHFERTRDLTEDDPHLFQVTIGALMAVPADLHRQVGGLRELGMRGIEDTEYGYRLHTAGALMVLDRTLAIWHQGRRFFDSSRADAAKRDRERLNGELMAAEKYRPDGSVPRRVPVAVVTSDAGVVVDGWAQSARKDVVIEDPTADDQGAVDPVDRSAAPYRFHFSRDCRLAPESVDLVLQQCRDRGLGRLHVVDEQGTEVVTVTSTRAEGRAQLEGMQGSDAAEHVAAAFGEWWMSAGQVGIDR